MSCNSQKIQVQGEWEGSQSGFAFLSRSFLNMLSSTKTLQTYLQTCKKPHSYSCNQINVHIFFLFCCLFNCVCVCVKSTLQCQ